MFVQKGMLNKQIHRGRELVEPLYGSHGGTYNYIRHIFTLSSCEK